MTNPATLVFDLDGTLSDPAVGIGRSINYALMAFGHPPIDEAEVSLYIGPPLDHSFRLITGSASALHATELVSKFRHRYGQVGYCENMLYTGIPEALASLRARGFLMGVCTSKRADFAEKILQLFGLKPYFSFVSGGDVGVEKASQLRSLLDEGVIDHTAAMIGDRDVDIRAAQANGLRSIGVLWGHGSATELQEAGADLLLQSVAELSHLFDRQNHG